MPPLTLRTVRIAVAAAVVACNAASAAPDVEGRVHRDGFEPIDPAALVLDAVDRSEAIRIAATEHWYSTAQFPVELPVLGFANPFPAGPARATLQAGVLLLEFDGALAGEQLAFSAWLQADAMHWVCGRAPPPLDATLMSAAPSTTHTTLPDALLPDACRSTPSPATLAKDAWDASANARISVAEHWLSVAPPATLAEVGLADPLPIARARLALDDGLLVATFADPLDGETLAIEPWLQAGSLRWVCGHAPPPVDATLQSGDTAAARTTLTHDVLPQACRNDPPLATQVHDALIGTAAARLTIVEFWTANAALPATLAAAGLPDPFPVGRTRLHLDEGVLVATLVGDLDDERLALAPYDLGGALVWVCGAAAPPPAAVPLATGTAAAKTTLDHALLPAACR